MKALLLRACVLAKRRDRLKDGRLATYARDRLHLLPSAIPVQPIR